MKKFSDFWLKRPNETILDFVDNYDYEQFGKSIEASVQKYRDQYDGLKNEVHQLNEKIISIEKEIGDCYSEEILTLIHESVYIQEKINNYTYLDTLFEMKIINLFRSVELNIKSLIRYAYPNVEVKSFYRWDMMQSFFKSKNIDLTSIVHYDECNELRNLNNCIKHSRKITKRVQEIQEFKGTTQSIEFEQLEKFYKRIISKIPLFVQALKEEIKNDLYEFSDERLGRIVRDYYERMDEETYERFSLRIKKADSI